MIFFECLESFNKYYGIENWKLISKSTKLQKLKKINYFGLLQHFFYQTKEKLQRIGSVRIREARIKKLQKDLPIDDINLVLSNINNLYYVFDNHENWLKSCIDLMLEQEEEYLVV